MTVISQIPVRIYQTTWNDVPEESSFNTQQPREPQISRILLIMFMWHKFYLGAAQFIEFLIKRSFYIL